MTKLAAKLPCDGMLPITIGSVTLSEDSPASMTSVAPYKGRDAALSEALKAAHGMAFPAPNRATGKAGSRAVWFGQGVALLMGPAPDAGLAGQAALSDQTDAWCVVRLEGAGARDVLARLTPVDLRHGTFRTGHTARTELMHMAASITRVGPKAYQVMVFRAFARTLVHDLETAMQGVAARAPR